jgi:gluconokinase
MIIYIMGVSGSGKSTVGKQLADSIGWPFYDGDDFHPAKNIKKMAAGLALQDEDRWPWLESIRAFAKAQLKTDRSLVIACSALKETYREALSKGIPEGQIRWVYLKGDYELILSRMEARSSHFMPSLLLKSQFDALEEPPQAVTVSIDQPVEVILQQLAKQLSIR